MRQIITNTLNEVYEILLRLIPFLVFSLGVTYALTIDVLTGFLWLSLHHWVYGLILADFALLISIPFFSPNVVFEMVGRAVSYYKDVRGKVPEFFQELKGLTFEQRLVYLKRYIDDMELVNGHEDLKEPLKVLKDAFELAEAIILEDEDIDTDTTILEDSDESVITGEKASVVYADTYSKTHTNADGTPKVVSTATIKAKTEE